MKGFDNVCQISVRSSCFECQPIIPRVAETLDNTSVERSQTRSYTYKKPCMQQVTSYRWGKRSRMQEEASNDTQTKPTMSLT